MERILAVLLAVGLLAAGCADTVEDALSRVSG